jgi:hypothetical protein
VSILVAFCDCLVNNAFQILPVKSPRHDLQAYPTWASVTAGRYENVTTPHLSSARSGAGFGHWLDG